MVDAGRSLVSENRFGSDRRSRSPGSEAGGRGEENRKAEREEKVPGRKRRRDLVPRVAVSRLTRGSHPRNTFISPKDYAHPDIVCHLAATPAGLHAPVNAGDVLAVRWAQWPTSHHGPVIDYLANCNGPCVRRRLPGRVPAGGPQSGACLSG